MSAVLFVGSDAFDRFGVIVRHLAVGLIDQAVHVRTASSDRRVEALQLGPVQPVLYRPLRRPWVQRRAGALLDALAQPVPTVIHALSADVYTTSAIVSDAFDADLLLQVSSRSDCEGATTVVTRRDPRFVAVSAPLVEILQRQHRIPRERIDLIRPGILASEKVACFLEAERIPSVLCTSALAKDSGIDHLLSALTILQARDLSGGSVLTFLLGSGPMESSLRRLVRELGLSASVTFAHPAGDVARAMESGDIFILPAAMDAFHVDTLQAMGAGMAVVTAPSGVCDHLRDGETAIVCASCSAAGIADVLGRLLHDRSFARQIAEGAHAYVQAHHSMSAMAEGIGGVYRNLAMKRATFPIAE